MDIKQLQCVTVGILLLSVPWAYANSVKTPMPMSEVLQQLQNHGYTVLQQIEYKKGVYAGNAMSAKGTRVKVFFNPQTDTIKATQISQSQAMGLLEVATHVEQAGYHDISKIEVQKNGRQFAVKALSVTNKPVNLEVNSKTGTISREA